MLGSVYAEYGVRSQICLSSAKYESMCVHTKCRTVFAAALPPLGELKAERKVISHFRLSIRDEGLENDCRGANTAVGQPILGAIEILSACRGFGPDAGDSEGYFDGTSPPFPPIPPSSPLG